MVQLKLRRQSEPVIVHPKMKKKVKRHSVPGAKLPLVLPRNVEPVLPSVSSVALDEAALRSSDLEKLDNAEATRVALSRELNAVAASVAFDSLKDTAIDGILSPENTYDIKHGDEEWRYDGRKQADTKYEERPSALKKMECDVLQLEDLETKGVATSRHVPVRSGLWEGYTMDVEADLELPRGKEEIIEIAKHCFTKDGFIKKLLWQNPHIEKDQGEYTNFLYTALRMCVEQRKLYIMQCLAMEKRIKNGGYGEGLKELKHQLDVARDNVDRDKFVMEKLRIENKRCKMQVTQCMEENEKLKKEGELKSLKVQNNVEQCTAWQVKYEQLQVEMELELQLVRTQLGNKSQAYEHVGKQLQELKHDFQTYKSNVLCTMKQTQKQCESDFLKLAKEMKQAIHQMYLLSKTNESNIKLKKQYQNQAMEAESGTNELQLKLDNIQKSNEKNKSTIQKLRTELQDTKEKQQDELRLLSKAIHTQKSEFKTTTLHHQDSIARLVAERKTFIREAEENLAEFEALRAAKAELKHKYDTLLDNNFLLEKKQSQQISHHPIAKPSYTNDEKQTSLKTTNCKPATAPLKKVQTPDFRSIYRKLTSIAIDPPEGRNYEDPTVLLPEENELIF